MIHGSSRIRSMDTLRPESREATPACMAAQLRAHSPVGPSSPADPRNIPDTETGWSEPMSGCPRATSRPLRFLWRSLSLKDLPVVGRIKVDDIVGYYNLTAECVFERLPPRFSTACNVATSLPRFVRFTEPPLWFTSSSTARHVALNSVADI